MGSVRVNFLLTKREEKQYMSFFDNLRLSLESDAIEPVEPITEEQEQVEIAQDETAEVKAEEIRRDVETDLENAERAAAIVEELEGQNEAIQGAIERDGGLDETTAAFVESSRRAAAVGLGLDPEEGPGSEVVGVESIRYMVENRGQVALEGVKEMIEKIREFIAKAYAGAREKLREWGKALVALLSSFINRAKRTYNRVVNMNDEAYEEAVKRYNEEGKKTIRAYLENGAPVDLTKMYDKFATFFKQIIDTLTPETVVKSNIDLAKFDGKELDIFGNKMVVKAAGLKLAINPVSGNPNADPADLTANKRQLLKVIDPTLLSNLDKKLKAAVAEAEKHLEKVKQVDGNLNQFADGEKASEGIQNTRQYVSSIVTCVRFTMNVTKLFNREVGRYIRLGEYLAGTKQVEG